MINATQLYIGSTPVDKVYMGSTLVWGASSTYHSIWSTWPAAQTLYADGGTLLRMAQAFYRVGATTDGWRVDGGRVYIPAGEVANLPANVTISLFTHPYADFTLPNISGTPLRTVTVPVQAGWTTGYWTPYAIDVGLNEVAWIMITFGNGQYLYSADWTGDLPVQAEDGSAIYLAEDSGPQSNSALSFNGGATQGSNGLYGIDIVFDEGA